MIFNSNDDLTKEIYVTVQEADSYCSLRLDTTSWLDYSDDAKQKAIYMATERIDRLKYRGCKSGTNLEFPRNGDTVIPIAIKKACCLIAFQLLDGRDIELEIETNRVVSEGHSAARATYDPGFALEHITAGIPSYEAWSLLKPYLIDPRALTISRVG